MVAVKCNRKLPLPKLSLGGVSPHKALPGASAVSAPTYRPSAEQFKDALEYIECVRAQAEAYGMCCVVPPGGWSPECCVSQQLRFITELQYIHKMKQRWGPCVQQMGLLHKHLAAENVRFEHPLVGGIELDLPALSRAVRTCGGISAIADDKRKWQKVADILRMPKRAQDRSFKLYEHYCKYLLSFDSLNADEKAKLESQVLADRNRGHVDLECVLKSKSRSLDEFFNTALNINARWFDKPPTPEDVEAAYWGVVEQRDEHVAVLSAHVDTKNCGGGFPTKKDSPYAKHGWNFNVLQTAESSVLKHLGLVSGVTIPELHMGMLFSTNCWCSDPHGLPYISYLHTGGDIIWLVI